MGSADEIEKKASEQSVRQRVVIESGRELSAADVGAVFFVPAEDERIK